MNPPATSPLSPVDAHRIERHAAAADAAGFLHPVHQALLHRRGWLKMLAPRAAGGAELPLPEVVRLEEAVAAIDGSMGWVLTLCAGAGWFAGFLAPELARQIIGTPRVCLGGSGASTGYADEDDDGYRISGRWDYASGAPMATHFTLNAILRANGQPLLDEQGAPRSRAFLVPAALVRVEDNWRSIGMRASASHSYRIEDAWVSKEHGFTIRPDAATANGPLYRFPFYSLAYVTLAANVAGMASHFVRLARECIGRRQKGMPLLEEKEQSLHAARTHFYQTLDRSWAQVAGGITLSDDDMLSIQTSSLKLVATARAAVDELYPYCGLHAAHAESTINRVWRDFHTASQHSLLLPA
ncbi:acyl-CoA dehydrogenase [Duganella radicis]|uniref:Acyl-CoA dehydrogenase n=1 Tax=Duganella radicis TaxID=551988 RepID=A0A6L6PRF4_9BURK|nr:acyl-CoA dehydrogenase [Duganella radicis]MTV41231.1 acyl-CoA dehydrogenase [Duganella radicis]